MMMNDSSSKNQKTPDEKNAHTETILPGYETMMMDESIDASKPSTKNSTTTTTKTTTNSSTSKKINETESNTGRSSSSGGGGGDGTGSSICKTSSTDSELMIIDEIAPKKTELLAKKQPLSKKSSTSSLPIETSNPPTNTKQAQAAAPVATTNEVKSKKPPPSHNTEVAATTSSVQQPQQQPSSQILSMAAPPPTKLNSDDAEMVDLEAALKELSNQQNENDKLRYIIIDGSNVAREHGSQTFNGQQVFSCRGIKIVVDYFLYRGHKNVKAFVPRYRRGTSDKKCPTVDGNVLDELEKKNNLIYTPSRYVGNRLICPYDDRFIVRAAMHYNAVIVSNDNYRDLIEENNAWAKHIMYNLLQYSFLGDLFMVADDPLGRNGPSIDVFLSNNNNNNNNNKKQQHQQLQHVSGPSGNRNPLSKYPFNYLGLMTDDLAAPHHKSSQPNNNNNQHHSQKNYAQRKPEKTKNASSSSSSSNRKDARSSSSSSGRSPSRENRCDKYAMPPPLPLPLPLPTAFSKSTPSFGVSRPPQSFQSYQRSDNNNRFHKTSTATRPRDMSTTASLYGKLTELFPNKTENKIKHLLSSYETIQDLNFFVNKILEEDSN